MHADQPFAALTTGLLAVGASPITPPAESAPASLLGTAALVLRSQALALAHLAELYTADAPTQAHYTAAIQLMHNALVTGGKIVLTGMGKSGKIADKITATMTSLGVHAVALHPCDALHGDLGTLRPADVLVMITASGNTPELLALLPHVPESLPRICLTCAPDSPLARAASAILSAHLPPALSERELHGVPAPTTSTTACLALGDAVALTLAEMLAPDPDERRQSFARWHPGGAIGSDFRAAQSAMPSRPQIRHAGMVPWTEVGAVDLDADTLDLLRAAAGKPWVCVAGARLFRARDLATAHSSAGSSVVDDDTDDSDDTDDCARPRALLLESMRRLGPKDDPSTVAPGETVLVASDYTILGIYERP
ncbi:uncharacterized protein V1518DRAFT_418441 [Limtongia smithiae]|uniref:uncharacterized protein n=1 Tax=Limtongia smithiae TaxID=1125753 RepID=UPI0034CFEA2A